MSCSPAQLQANRQNAQSSTGPKSVEGKAASASNAIKHGFFSRDVVVSGEDPAEFQALHEEYVRDLCPRNIVEREMVERIVVSLWKRNRLPKLEQRFWASDHTFSKDPGTALLRLSTYETRLNNTVDRCLRQLRQMKKEAVVESAEQTQWTPVVRNEANPTPAIASKPRNEPKMTDLTAIFEPTPDLPLGLEGTIKEFLEKTREPKKKSA